jgi:hypothetical protein
MLSDSGLRTTDMAGSNPVVSRPKVCFGGRSSTPGTFPELRLLLVGRSELGKERKALISRIGTNRPKGHNSF